MSEEKIRFSEYVFNEVMEKNNFHGPCSYRWYQDGYIGSHEFRIYFSKENFWTKKVVKLSRRVDKYSSIDIKLTREEQEKLWPIQYHAEKIEQQRQVERDAKRKIELEALEWWP